MYPLQKGNTDNIVQLRISLFLNSKDRLPMNISLWAYMNIHIGLHLTSIQKIFRKSSSKQHFHNNPEMTWEWEDLVSYFYSDPRYLIIIQLRNKGYWYWRTNLKPQLQYPSCILVRKEIIRKRGVILAHKSRKEHKQTWKVKNVNNLVLKPSPYCNVRFALEHIV